MRIECGGSGDEREVAPDVAAEPSSCWTKGYICILFTCNIYKQSSVKSDMIKLPYTSFSLNFQRSRGKSQNPLVVVLYCTIIVFLYHPERSQHQELSAIPRDSKTLILDP